jgi:hypothetical protein
MLAAEMLEGGMKADFAILRASPPIEGWADRYHGQSSNH